MILESHPALLKSQRLLNRKQQKTPTNSDTYSLSSPSHSNLPKSLISRNTILNQFKVLTDPSLPCVSGLAHWSLGLWYSVISSKHPPCTNTPLWFFHTKVETRKQKPLPLHVNFLPNILMQKPRLWSSTQPLLIATLLQVHWGSIPALISPPGSRSQWILRETLSRLPLQRHTDLLQLQRLLWHILGFYCHPLWPNSSTISKQSFKVLTGKTGAAC